MVPRFYVKENRVLIEHVVSSSHSFKLWLWLWLWLHLIFFIPLSFYIYQSFYLICSRHRYFILAIGTVLIASFNGIVF